MSNPEDDPFYDPRTGRRAGDPPEPTYLGDGLYASWDGHQIELYASNGIRKTNSVFLDGQVFAAFEEFVQRIKDANKPG